MELDAEESGTISGIMSFTFGSKSAFASHTVRFNGPTRLWESDQRGNGADQVLKLARRKSSTSLPCPNLHKGFPIRPFEMISCELGCAYATRTAYASDTRLIQSW